MLIGRGCPHGCSSEHVSLLAVRACKKEGFISASVRGTLRPTNTHWTLVLFAGRELCCKAESRMEHLLSPIKLLQALSFHREHCRGEWRERNAALHNYNTSHASLYS